MERPMTRSEFRAWLASDAAAETLKRAVEEGRAEDERELIGEAPDRARERPDPEWRRGTCPVCGDDLVSNVYWFGGKGYLIQIECWGSLAANSGRPNTCSYRRTL